MKAICQSTMGDRRKLPAGLGAAIGRVGLFGLGLLLVSPCFAQNLDTLIMANGQTAVGRLVGLDAQSYRLQKELPPPPGISAGAPPMFATLTIPRKNVAHIEFALDEEREKRLKDATPAQMAMVEAAWKQFEPWLASARSPTGRIGLVYADLLLRTGDAGNAQKALDLFKTIETQSWDRADAMLARPGRLRAMIATGNAMGAVKEATELEKSSEDPSVLVEAKYILAEAADNHLRKLVEENPRWEEDPFVIPERNRLYNEALDYYLYASLFFGSQADAAARGLWGALGVYRFTGEQKKATEAARDLVGMYPGTKYAKLAGDFIAALPESLRKKDHEKEDHEKAAQH